MHQIPLTDNEREYPNEYTEVERPLPVQLAAMGWQCVRGDLDYPQKTFRERFREVILTDKLRDAIRRINRDDDGNPYLDDVTIDRAIRELLTTMEFGAFDKNRELTDNRDESKDSTTTQTQPRPNPTHFRFYGPRWRQ